MTARRVMAALLAMMLGASVAGGLLSSPWASAAGAGPASDDSAVTVSGKGEFANLQVTVSQTKNLINQTVRVSWTGGEPTLPSGGDFGVNYLQIMQCWGDDPAAGPDRTQCQYGGSSTQGSPSAGNFVRSRQVNYGANLVDPREKIKQTPGSFQNVYVPFWAVGHPRPADTDAALSNNNDFFDSQVTNEIPLGSTHGDGSGEQFFEIETVRQAAGLGCGDPVTAGANVGRPCWLVIVPRGITEVDGSTRHGSNFDRLDSSPLSQTNWDHRLFVRLDFLPVGQACPIGAPERQLIGHEIAADAVRSWQPALCAGGGALYSYTQLSDDVSRNKVLDGSTPGLALVTNPIPPDKAQANPPLVYAPVGLSGLAIAFNVEHQPPGNAPPDILQLAGQRFQSMTLTPRLVAKLLTQSYQGSVVGSPAYLQHNPPGLTGDPEFLELNPEYKGFADTADSQPPDALVQLDGADVTSLLWSWVKADPDASAFITGTPDKWGMVVNPANKGLALPTPTFPRNDSNCVDAFISNTIKGTFCTLDAHPFTLDMHDAGRSASRGDTQARTTVLAPDGKTTVPKKIDRQDPGHRALLAVVDVATATRYGLPTAALRNAAGKFVAPTTASLLASENAMKPSAVPGVVAPDPLATDPGAYPLTALSYAVTAPSTLDAAAGKDYATFLRYAGGPGQQAGIEPGQLPLGLVPLPDTLKAQTIAAAATIEAHAGKTTVGPATSAGATAGGAAGSAARGAGGGAGAGVAATTPGATGTRATGGVSAPRGVATQRASGPAPIVAQQPVARRGRTPSLPPPAVGAVILVVLIGGAMAATSAPVMHLVRTGLRRRPRKEVVPAEQ